MATSNQHFTVKIPNRLLGLKLDTGNIYKHDLHDLEMVFIHYVMVYENVQLNLFITNSNKRNIWT